MLCEKCRIREANIRYTEIINGVKTEHSYCAQCAAELNFTPGPYSALIEGEFPLGKLLSGILGLTSSGGEQKELADVVCPTCGTTYKDFVENSRFGCSDCYHVFDLLIGEKISKLQDKAVHRGKHPKMRPGVAVEAEVARDGNLELSREEQIRQLEREREAAVRAENYELAAACRDQIRKLTEMGEAGEE